MKSKPLVRIFADVSTHSAVHQYRVLVEIAGRLNALLGEQAFPNKVRGVWGKMVAGERFIRFPPLISAFSLSAAPLAEATHDWRAMPTPTLATVGSRRSFF
uniref:Uncharacterized protein n=1 Tax=Rhodopseudomonas palustris (strain BisA53) TaxID=316055 RepID=Q07SW6_RHOP5